MSDQTPDAVAQAREKYDRAVASLDAIRGIEFDVADEEKAVEDAWLEVIAAVRASCAAKVRAIQPVSYIDLEDGAITARYAAVLVRDVLAALEAQP